MLVHATSIAINGQAVLLLGRSGAGKSDVAIRLIDQGGSLVSDDQTELFLKNGQLCAKPPESLAGMIEMRYAGILELPFQAEVPVTLCVELLKEKESLERLPEPFFHSFLDCSVRGVRLPSYEASTPSKIRLIMQGKLIDDPAVKP